jgi:tetratricopeptide (TPR) repeat protein
MEKIQDSDFWKDQGNVYYKTGNYIDAIICYKRALEINPVSDKAWYNLGMVYNRMNNKKDSRLCFKKSQELSGVTIKNSLIFRSPPAPDPAGNGIPGNNPPDKTRESGPESSVDKTEWRELLYPGEWCIWFVLVGLLTSASDNPVLMFMYYTSAIAALVTLGFLLFGLVKHARGTPSKAPAPFPAPRAWRNPNPLSSSSMNVRTWAIFFLICFVALLWAVFLSNQGMMLWVSFALVMIVVGFNLIFIFRN